MVTVQMQAQFFGGMYQKIYPTELQDYVSKTDYTDYIEFCY